jgi:hypothetical protein
VRFLLLLELELAEIHDAANRWVRHRLDFDQIQADVLGHFQRFFTRQDSYLFTVRADYTYPRNANFRILAVSFFSGDNSTPLFVRASLLAKIKKRASCPHFSIRASSLGI